ncbi:MAG: VTT domain-containing protein [Dehalobacterium sp.]
MEKQKKMLVFFNIAVTVILILAMIWATIKYGPFVTQLAANPDQLKAFLSSYGGLSILVFIGLQTLQVIIAAIPGELVQIAGGFVYGTWLGTLYSIIGITIGSVIAFYISRALGLSLLRIFISQENLEKFSFLINKPKSKAAILILLLIPGIPKDIFSYIAGITPIKPLTFFIISTTARLPSLLMSCYIGANMQQGKYVTAAIITAIACLLCMAGLFAKDRIVTYVQKILCNKKLNTNI